MGRLRGSMTVHGCSPLVQSICHGFRTLPVFGVSEWPDSSAVAPLLNNKAACCVGEVSAIAHVTMRNLLEHPSATYALCSLRDSVLY